MDENLELNTTTNTATVNAVNSGDNTSCAKNSNIMNDDKNIMNMDYHSSGQSQQVRITG